MSVMSDKFWSRLIPNDTNEMEKTKLSVGYCCFSNQNKLVCFWGNILL